MFTKDIIKLPYCKFGDFTYGKPNVIRWGNIGTLTVGKFCCISENVTFLLDADHRMEWVTTYPFTSLKVQKHLKWMKPQPYIESKGNTIVENDVWIGYDATILPGVKIKDGAIIGAKSVVTKDVDSYQIVAGNPAKLIRYRFPQLDIFALLKIKWWDWDIQKIKQNVELMKNTSQFIKVHYHDKNSA
jgi:lipopolysaccharide transport system ATP-binding protein